MIDVMMILSLFLAVMAFLPQVRTSIQAQLPSASSAEQTPPSVTIDLTREGIAIDQKPLSADALTAAVQDEVAKNPETSFVIAADKSLPYEQVMNLLDRVKSSGAKRIALAATKE
jgi:biopolymer transport protein ExbD